MKGIKYGVIAAVSTLLFFFNGAEVNAQACDTILAGFSSNAPRCSGDSVDFVFTQNVYGTVTYDWNFGAGASPATSTTKDPSGITYSTPGLKLVTLTVTHPGLGCTHTTTEGVSIVETPSPSFLDDGPKCEEEEFTFTYNGTNKSGWIYNWDFGSGSNPAVSGAKDPTGVKYTGSGLKNVSLTVTNGSCAASFGGTVTVSNKPDAGFSVVSPTCTNDSNNFNNTGTSGVGYAWNFGVGASPLTASNENPTNIFYSSSGAKTVQQIVTQGTCSDTSILSISVTEKPAPDFSTNSPQCEGADVNFTYIGSTGTGWTYSWDFGTGSSPSSSTAANPTGVKYVGAGSKNVFLTVSNQNCSKTFTDIVDINTTPQSGFSSSTPACSGDSVNFSNTGTPSVDYLWDLGSGATPTITTQENPQGIIYSTPGIKSIRQVVTQGLCKDTSFGSVSVTETPVPNFMHNGNQCEGAPVNFTYNGSTGTGWTYLWDFGQGANPAVSSAQNPMGIEYLGSGVKTVTLTVTNQFCSETITLPVTIDPTPSSGFSSNAPGCTEDSVNFQNTGTAGVGYEWTFGSGATPSISTDENPLGIIYATAGFKTVRQISTQGSCKDTTWHTISLTETPNPSFTNPSTCQGSSHNFTYTGTTGANWTYSWDLGTSSTPRNSSAMSPQGIIYSGSVSLTTPVTVTVTNQGCSRTFQDSAYIEYTPPAFITNVASACSGDSVQFLGSGSSFQPTSSWTFTGTPSNSTQISPMVVFQPGTQLATLKVTSGNCSDSTSSSILIYETPTVGIQSTAPQCVGNNVSFANQGSSGNNWNYIWDFGSGAVPSISTAEVPTAINYSNGGIKTVSLSVSDANCGVSDTTQIEIYALPIANAGPDTTICADECVQIGDSPIAGNAYSWFPSSTLDDGTIANPTACPLASINTYTVVTTDANNCLNSDTIIVTMLPSAIARAGSDVELCIGESVQIGSALIKGQTYVWSPSIGLDSDTIPSPIANPDTTTTYQVAVSYRGCPEITDEVVVIVHNNPVVNAGEDVTIAKGSSTQLVATGAVMYQWTPSTGLSNSGIPNPVASPEETITYLVEFTDINSCVSFDSLTITVIEADAWAPDAFTPNNDLRNDVFYVRINGQVTFELVIFNRNGETVFRSTNPDNGWDGTKQGTKEKLMSGAYVYSAKGELSDGSAFSINGIVNLIR